MEARRPRALANVLLVTSLACSATVIALLLRPPVPRWTTTLSVVSILCVLVAVSLLRRRRSEPDR